MTDDTTTTPGSAHKLGVNWGSTRKHVLTDTTPDSSVHRADGRLTACGHGRVAYDPSDQQIPEHLRAVALTDVEWCKRCRTIAGVVDEVAPTATPDTVSTNVFDIVTSPGQLLRVLAGAASMCWTDVKDAGEYMPEMALALTDAAETRLTQLIEQGRA